MPSEEAIAAARKICQVFGMFSERVPEAALIIDEALANVWDKAIEAVHAQVKVEEGNTEINDAYFEVRYLGRKVWACGGRMPNIKREAQSFASQYRDKLSRVLSAAKARSLNDQPTVVEFEAAPLKSERTD